MADDVSGQIVSHEAIDAFAGKLQFRWNNGCFARCEDEEDGNQKNRQEDEQDGLCEVLVIAEKGGKVEVVAAWRDESSAFSA